MLARTAATLAALQRVEPEVVVADAHPAYLSRRWAAAEAARRGVRTSCRAAPPRAPRLAAGRARLAAGRAGARRSPSTAPATARRHDLGRRAAARLLRAAWSGSATCDRCRCPAATPPSAARCARRWRTSPPRASSPTGLASVAARRARRARRDRAGCCDRAPAARRRRAWAGCSTRRRAARRAPGRRLRGAGGDGARGARGLRCPGRRRRRGVAPTVAVATGCSCSTRGPRSRAAVAAVRGGLRRGDAPPGVPRGRSPRRASAAVAAVATRTGSHRGPHRRRLPERPAHDRCCQAGLRARASRCWCTSAVPPNDGGLALGQVAVAAGGRRRRHDGRGVRHVPRSSRTGRGGLGGRRHADGTVDFGGVRKEVCLAYVPDVDGRRLHDRPRRLRAHQARRGVGAGDPRAVPQRRPPRRGARRHARRHGEGRDEVPRRVRRPGPRARACSTTSARTVTRPWALMEVCGGQTHTIIRNGIDQLLPEEVELIHGPGCPVCVTPLETIDRALAIAARPDVIFCSFGDMLRVPGSRRDLFRGQERGRRRPHRLLAARRRAARAGEPRQAGRVLRHRLRDHRAGQRDDRARWPSSWGSRTSRCSSRTCWCRRRSARSWTRRAAGCRASSPPGTSAR